MNKQKDRLVELLGNANKEVWNLIHISCCEERLKLLEEINKLRADYLIENGVIVPPCKVGDVVYQTVLLKDKTGFIVERKVVGFHLGDFPDIRGHKRMQYLIIHHDATNSITHIDIAQIGKTVFLTKEEAEAKLKEGVQG